jgi:hypothetical protein
MRVKNDKTRPYPITFGTPVIKSVEYYRGKLLKSWDLVEENSG